MRKVFFILSILGIIGIGIIFYFTTLVYAPKFFSVEQKILKVFEDKTIKEENIGIPVIIRIPKLNINTHIESVNLTKLNSIDVAKDFANVGWYNLSSKPGEIGTSVIDGHFGWKKSIRGVFNDLNKLEIGDEIFIEDTNRNIITFIVKISKEYDKSDDTEEVFYSSDGKSHLNLISCFGLWNKIEKTYPNRLVIFTERK